MHFLLVLVICLAFLPEHGTRHVHSPAWSVVLTWLAVGLLGITAELLSRHYAWQALQKLEYRARTLRRYQLGRFLHLALMIGAYFWMLLGLGWGAVVRANWGLENAILIDELLLLAPFITCLVLEWLCFYRVEYALHQTSPIPSDMQFWTRGAYVAFHARHYLGLVLAPIIIFTGMHELLLWQWPQLAVEPFFQLGVLGLLMGVTILLIMPWLLKVIWGAKPLPEGPLRDRLLAAARRLRFRCTNILLWNTRGCVANALVTGVLPLPRYVLLSDGLVQHLEPEEIEAVFGHEVGHVKHSHMLLYLCFLVLSLTLVSLVMPSIELTNIDATSVLTGLAFLGGYIWLVFGFLSRRCERQADVYGCKAVSCSQSECQGHEAEPGAARSFPNWSLGTSPRLCPTGIGIFIRALEKVADLNGIRRDRYNWRHASIARRVAFLERLRKAPSEEHHFQLSLMLTKLGLVFILCLLIGLASWVQYS